MDCDRVAEVERFEVYGRVVLETGEFGGGCVGGALVDDEWGCVYGGAAGGEEGQAVGERGGEVVMRGLRRRSGSYCASWSGFRFSVDRHAMRL